jgi:hypothetical protein
MRKIFLILNLFCVLCLLLFVSVPKSQAQQSCSVTPTSTDSVTSTVTISQTGSYVVWSRLLAPDTINNSYFLQIDGGCAIIVGDGNIPVNTWTWVNYQNGNSASPINLSLTSGDHTVTMTSREGGVGIDRVLFTQDTSCIPTGTGDNCAVVPTMTPQPTVLPTVIPTTIIVTPTSIPTLRPTPTPTPVIHIPTPTPTPSDKIPPSITITSPKNGSSVKRGTTVTISANASDNVKVQKVQFLVNGASLCTITSSPYNCKWNVPQSIGVTYTIVGKAYDAAGNTNSASIKVTSSR